METTGTQPSPNTRDQFDPLRVPIGLPWRLSLATGALFVLSLLVYFGLRFGYRSYLEKQENRATANLESLAEQVSSDEQEQFVTLYSQIVNLKAVLDQHRFSANLFPVLERNVVEGIIFTGAEFTTDTAALKLDGTTSDLGNLALQVAEFGKAPEVSRVIVEKVGISGSSVIFTISLTFTPNALIRPLAS